MDRRAQSVPYPTALAQSVPYPPQSRELDGVTGNCAAITQLLSFAVSGDRTQRCPRFSVVTFPGSLGLSNMLPEGAGEGEQPDTPHTHTALGFPLFSDTEITLFQLRGGRS